MLHSVRRGEGPPLVLMAGIGMAGAAWDPVLDRLARERETWAVDLPGFGRSAWFADGAPCGIEALSDSVEAFLGEAGLERPHVAGNSLGGAVALELGRRDVVASVTALSPAGFASAVGGGSGTARCCSRTGSRARWSRAGARCSPARASGACSARRCSPTPSGSRPTRPTRT